MLTQNIEQMKSEISAHIKADSIIQGKYWKELIPNWDEDKGKGGFVGCLTKSKHADILAERYGIPLGIVHLLEGIFDSLPKKDSVVFFKDIGDAIDVDNKDLSKIHYSFLRDMLKLLPSITKTTQDVIDGLDLLSQGKNWPEQKAVKAKADAARSVAATAAYSYDADKSSRAAYYAYSAADAAYEAVRSVCTASVYDAAEVATLANASVYDAQAKSAWAALTELQAAAMIVLLKDAPIMENNNAN